MAMQSDIAISRTVQPLPLERIAAQLGIGEHLLEPYGRGAAKISLDAIGELADRPLGRYVVVTAVTPTPPGEGKTATTVGLGQGFGYMGESAAIAIRQPSMGPTFGMKGGAAGGGYSQVVPMEVMNLHLTGDLHAVTQAHNLLAAMVDNSVHQGNPHDIGEITWRRVLDIADRGLRDIVTGLGGRANGAPRQTGFDITAASEVMAVLALSSSLRDLRQRLGRMVVGYSRDGEPVTAEMVRGAGAMTVMLHEAIKPNLMQTMEGTPVLVHCGPFGNIAHGNSSVVADLVGIRAADYLITEAGFSADMGAERFFNIKCRTSGLVPDAAVVVATVRALKMHSGRYEVRPGAPMPAELFEESVADVMAGAENLRRQIANVRRHGVTPVVAVNAFPTDHRSEQQAILAIAAEEGVRGAVSTHFADGGRGAAELVAAVIEACEEPSSFRFLYGTDVTLEGKIDTIARELYGADGLDVSPLARRQLDTYERHGFGSFPVCIAKTHLSLSADPTRKGVPTGWRLPVREVRVSAGAGYVYPICGDMRTMPGLSATSAAERIDIDENDEIVGLD